MDFVITPKEISEEEVEGEEQLPDTGVLPADHPLMIRFQQALKEHLLKVTAQLESEVADLDHAIKEKDDDIAEMGAKLFDMNNAIDMQREELDKYSKGILEFAEKRKVHEENIARYKAELSNKESTSKHLSRVNKEASQQITAMRVLESEISKWNEEIQNEISLAKRVSSKDKKDQRLVSEEKKILDLMLYNLDSEVRKNERKLANLDNQIQEHSDSVACLNTSLADANVDLEGLQQEHKKLMQAWGEIIVAVQHRDKALMKAKMELL